MAIRYPTNYDKIADIPADLEDMAESIQDELDLKVNKVTGKGLSTNDYTDDEKSKLAGITTGAEVNVIETVKVNGTALTPSNKAVDVTVPTKTSDLTNDSGFGTYTKPSGGIPKTDLASAVQTSLEKADSALQEHQNISGKEDKSNKVTSISSSSTNTQYPSAKLVYDELKEKQDQIDTLVEENTTLKAQIPTGHKKTDSVQLTDSAGGLAIDNVALWGATEQGENPSPDYQQTIHKVTGNCNVKGQNKNFLPNLATSRSVNGINFVVNEDKSVTINGTATQLAYLVLTNSTNNLNNYTNKVFTMPDEFSRFPTGSNSVTYGFRDTSGNYLSGNNLASKDIGLVYLNIASGATINNLTVYPQIEEGSTVTDYIAHAEQNAPLTLGNIEAYEGDEIQIDYVQKAGYKKVTGARLVKNNAKIASYNGETITTEYKSTTGQLTTGATVIYKLATPVTTLITDPTLLAQLETLINMKTYKEVTHIDATGEDLAPVLEFNYYKDMTTIFDNLEARVELLEN